MKQLYSGILLFFILSTLQAQVPVLNSYRVSTPSKPVPTVYLDFDGYLIDSSSVWFGYTTKVTQCANSKLSAQQISEAFEIIAEDFRPFQLNVTTDSIAYETAPVDKRVRVVITTTSDWFPGYGGVAYIGSFTWGDDSPVMVWSNNLSYDSKYVGEAASHEVGHSLGLDHHGYYEEETCERVRDYHGGMFGESQETTWGPIMGSVYFSNVTTWYFGDPCKGSIRNDDHDLKIIKSVINQRADDHPQAQPTILENAIDTGYYVTGAGVIETRTDSDHFKIIIPADMNILIGAAPEKNFRSISNIDVRFKIQKQGGKAKDYRPRGVLDITIDTFLTAGTYDLFVAGDGDEFYTNYGSLGGYTFFVDSKRPLVSVDLGPDINKCGSAITRLDAKNEKLGNMVSYLWNTGETTRRIDAYFGEYSVTVTDKKTGAQDSDTVFIEGTPEIVVDFYFEGPFSTCKDATVNFKDLSYNACGEDPVEYMWDFGDGKGSNVMGDVSHKYPTPGYYTVNLNLRDTFGRWYGKQIDLFIPEPELPLVELGPEKFICRNNPLSLTAVTNSPTEPKYLWNTGQKTKSIDVTRTGKFWVRMTTPEGCVNSDTVIVSQSNETVPDFVSERVGLRTIAFTDKSVTCSPTGDIDSWYWDFGDRSRSTLPNPVHFYEEPGTYIVSLTTTNEFGEKTIFKDITIALINETTLYKGPVIKRPGRGNKVLLGSSSVIDLPAIITSSRFTVESNTKAEYQLLTVTGQLLSKGSLAPGINEVRGPAMDKGIFLMVLWNSQGKQTVRIVKK